MIVNRLPPDNWLVQEPLESVSYRLQPAAASDRSSLWAIVGFAFGFAAGVFYGWFIWRAW